MRRRDFLNLLCAVAMPFAAHAQSGGRVRRIGVLIAVKEDDEGRARLTAFQNGMKELGWSEGRDIQLDVRFYGGVAEAAQAYAAELIRLAPDVILANGNYAVASLKQQTATIPIVFAQVIDPVNAGFVESLARPGGNITGFVALDFGIGAKWVETIKEIAPHVTRLAMLRDPANPGALGQSGAVQAAASLFGVELKALDARDAVTIERGLSVFAREPNGGLIVLNSAIASVHRKLIADLAARLRLPAIYPFPFYVKSGGLVSYGIDNHDLWRKAAGYVDRILKGASPADLPVQEPTKFELVINLKTAKDLGLTVPPMLLTRANEVIE
jgi:putative tryptophan/tyrosine transport system substrate-binding protein